MTSCVCQNNDIPNWIGSQHGTDVNFSIRNSFSDTYEYRRPTRFIEVTKIDWTTRW